MQPIVEVMDKAITKLNKVMKKPMKRIKTEMVKTASGKRIAEYSCVTH